MANQIAKRFLLTALCFLLVGNSNAEVLVNDFRGTQVRLHQAAQRIIALSPHVVENVFSAGAGDRLVASVEYADYPPPARLIEQVGSNNVLNLERIVALQPDLVIVWGSGNKQRTIEQLQQLGVAVYVDEPKTLEDVAKSIRDIGQLAGTEAAAEAAVTPYLKGLEKFRKMNFSGPPISVFYQVWNRPLQTLNGSHLISQAIELCGGENVFADESVIAPTVSLEAVLEKDPQTILASGVSTTRPPWLEEWRAWPQLAAVRNNHLFYVPADHVQRHTLRLLSGVETICQQIQQVRDTAK